MKRFLKKTLLFATFIPFFCANPTHSTHRSNPFVVSFQNIKNDKIPVYYKGIRINPGPASVLPEDGFPFLFHVFISREAVPCKLQGNNIVCFQCCEKNSCDLYELKLSIERSDEGEISSYKWDIKKLPREKIPQRLPENALLVLFDPAFIEKLSDNETAHAPGSIMLPTIYFKRDDEEGFNKALLAATMTALDIEPFNKREYAVKPCNVSKTTASVVVPTAGF